MGNQQVVNGYSVAQADFGGGGKKLGAYFQTGPSSWKETDLQGKTTFNFVETNRDEWSVYLYDASRKVHIQIDLWRKKILYSDPNTPRRDQYDVLSSASIDGWLIEQATYEGGGKRLGSFFQTGPKKWKELDAEDKTKTHFVETGRDDWSVYMQDDSRKVKIQIDMWRKKVRYSDPKTPWRDQYDVGSAASVVGLMVREGFYAQGRFQQHGDTKTWHELDSAGKLKYEFTETGRDDWSVYMKDDSRKVKIQIDMWRKKIRYSDPNTPWRDQYDLLYAKS